MPSLFYVNANLFRLVAIVASCAFGLYIKPHRFCAFSAFDYGVIFPIANIHNISFLLVSRKKPKLMGARGFAWGLFGSVEAFVVLIVDSFQCQR